jgi:hypothetical protein
VNQNDGDKGFKVRGSGEKTTTEATIKTRGEKMRIANTRRLFNEF